MNPPIYNPTEINLVLSVLKRFRTIISDNEGLYGFSLTDLDNVLDRFPELDLNDEGAGGYDASRDVFHNTFAFSLEDNPEKILNEDEYPLVLNLWKKLKNA